jgi:type I restriction enzyme S subunit
VQSGDVLLNITGASIGRVCVAPRDICPANVNQHVSVIRSNGELDPRFLSFFVSSPRFQKFIWRTQAGATRQALTKQIIENFVVPAPSVEIQRAIATRLDAEFSAANAFQVAISAKLSELEKLPAALLRSAFSPNGD